MNEALGEGLAADAAGLEDFLGVAEEEQAKGDRLAGDISEVAALGDHFLCAKYVCKFFGLQVLSVLFS